MQKTANPSNQSNQAQSQFNVSTNKNESEVLKNQLEELRKNCTDQKTISSIDQTLNYLKQNYLSGNQQKQQVAQSGGDTVALNKDWNIFENFRNKMFNIERQIEDSILGDTRRHTMFRSMLDDMKRDMEVFDKDFSKLDKTIRKTEKELLDKYHIEEEEPEGTVGALKQVETRTVNGKSNAKVHCEYNLKDGSKIVRDKEFVDGQPQQTHEIKQ